MKPNHILKISWALLLIAALCSCSSTNYLTMNVVEPSPVFLPPSAQKVGIVDQSLPSDKMKKLDDLDKIFSAEGKNMDKDGAHAAVMGLFDELTNNNRFSEIKIIDSANVKSPGLGVFPAPLSWDKVQQICYENKVDLLFVLSFYDTDAHIGYKAIPIEITNPFGIKIPAIEQEVTISTLIKTGWRIYDPVNKFIIDEFIADQNVVSSGRGISPLVAAQAIVGRKEAVILASNQIGHNYAFRILPFKVRVTRTYYVRGTNNFKIAKRRAQTGNWDGAAELWNKEVSNPKMKVAGRATYNMAIINEINGDLNAAMNWASKSYTDYRNKLALHYLNILKKRNYRNQQLQQQTGQ